MSNFDRFLNMNSTIYTTDDIPEGKFNFYLTSTGSNALRNATSSNIVNTLVRRDLSGIINTGDTNCVSLNVNGASKEWVRINIGDVSNNTTFALPNNPAGQRWTGEIILAYTDGSNMVGTRKYAYYKAPIATGNGWFNQVYHLNNASGIDSSVSFNNSSGIFTFNISGNLAKAQAYLDRMGVAI
jgi:hypothetical protein